MLVVAGGRAGGHAGYLCAAAQVFGRVVKGMDVVTAIEGVKCDRLDRPFEEVKIVSTEVH